MKKFYKIFLLVIVLIFLSTYNSNKSSLETGNNSNFFKVNEIKIKNNILIKSEEIDDKLRKIYGKNIFTVKSNDILEPLKKIDFLETVQVKKKYPGTIIIRVFETVPAGFVYKNNKEYLIDSSSNLISFTDKNKFGSLPNIFGKNAENNFIKFLNRLKDNSFPQKKIKKFYFFEIGRWDIELGNDKIIKFPYQNIDEAIKKSIELINRKDFESYNVIDLRVPGKIIVE